MTHRTDRQIIEECIPAQLIRYLVECQLDEAEIDDECHNIYAALLDAGSAPMYGIYGPRRNAMARRLARIMCNVRDWLKENHFNSRKALIMALDWVIAINDAGIAKITHQGFIEVLERLAEIFNDAPKEIANWDKIEKSAIKAGYKFHEFFQKEGYYK